MASTNSLADSLAEHVSAIVGLFVTDLLERNHNYNEPMQLLLEYAFSELLAAPVSADEPGREDRLYRRWLLGHVEEVDPDLEVSFVHRLGQRQNERKGPAA